MWEDELNQIKKVLRTKEMKVLQNISGKIITNKENNKNIIRKQSGIENITRWERKRSRKWKEHIQRIEDSRIICIYPLTGNQKR